MRMLVVAAFAAALAAAAPVRAQSSPCPANMGSYHNLAEGESIRCTCPAPTGRRSVWGSERYTADSDVCRAAIHAGAVPAAGGEVTIAVAEGCPIFRGTPKNGVQSVHFGPFGRTFHFAKEAPACSTQTVDDPVADCPFTMSVFARMKPGQTWRCKCPEARMKGSGLVFGSTRYTTDSNVCLAARHAGAVEAAGGAITLRTGEGCAAFAATQNNGVATRHWGAFARSFAFADPLPPCAK